MLLRILDTSLDFRIIRQAYMEIAMIYLNITGNNLLPTPPPPEQDADDTAKQTEDGKTKKKRSKVSFVVTYLLSPWRSCGDWSYPPFSRNVFF